MANVFGVWLWICASAVFSISLGTEQQGTPVQETASPLHEQVTELTEFPPYSELVTSSIGLNLTLQHGVMSKNMCKKYGESVYVPVFDPVYEEFSLRDTCPSVEPLIVGGFEAEPREFPHMAYVGHGPKHSITWSCGGSLISEKYVLSAAHCTGKGNRKVRWARLGEYNVQSTSDERDGLAMTTTIKIIRRINHPSYKEPSLYNDISLYELKTEVQFSEYIRPACLHTEYMTPSRHGIVTGWGYTSWQGDKSDVLEKANLTMMTPERCKAAYLNFHDMRLEEGIKDELMFCAADFYHGSDTCQGDSGGPYQTPLYDPHCMYSLVGVTSFGVKCGEHLPGVYTRVSHYVPWIEDIVWQRQLFSR